jgi:acetyltransferase-like isoleucine patch superfamily enzyme
MNIDTEADFCGVAKDHPLHEQFMVLAYSQGGFSFIPSLFFRDWLDRDSPDGDFHIGKCSGFGVGSLVKYDGRAQRLRVGRFVAGGLRLKFLLNGQHESRTISTYMFSNAGMGLDNAKPPQYADSIIKNDVWIGDEIMMLGGGIIEDGCIIGARSVLPPNFRSEPYGIYAGNPARLIRFRFSAKLREALLDLCWWQMPLDWIRRHNGHFMADLTADEDRSLEILAELKKSKQASAQAVPAPVLAAPAPGTPAPRAPTP